MLLSERCGKGTRCQGGRVCGILCICCPCGPPDAAVEGGPRRQAAAGEGPSCSSRLSALAQQGWPGQILLPSNLFRTAATRGSHSSHIASMTD